MEKKERRYMKFDCDEKYCENEEYFDALKVEMLDPEKAGGLCRDDFL